MHTLFFFNNIDIIATEWLQQANDGVYIDLRRKNLRSLENFLQLYKILKNLYFLSYVSMSLINT